MNTAYPTPGSKYEKDYDDAEALFDQEELEKSIAMAKYNLT